MAKDAAETQCTVEPLLAVAEAYHRAGLRWTWARLKVRLEIDEADACDYTRCCWDSIGYMCRNACLIGKDVGATTNICLMRMACRCGSKPADYRTANARSGLHGAKRSDRCVLLLCQFQCE